MPRASRLKSSITLIEQAEISAVLQPAVHEVHGPDLIDRLRNDQWLRLLPHQTLARLDAQIEFQLAVDAVHPFVVPAKTLHVAQVQVAQAEPQLRWLSVNRINQLATSPFSTFCLDS